MRKYLVIALVSFQSLSEYRANFFINIFSTLVANLVLFLFWYYLAQSGVDIRPYTVKTLAFYYLLVAFISSLLVFRSAEIGHEIRRGTVSLHLLRPVNYLWLKFSSLLPEKVLKVTIGIFVLMLLEMLGYKFQIGGLASILLFSLSLVLALTINYLIYFSVGLMAFWTLEVHGFSGFINTIALLFSGVLIPLEFLPRFLENWSNFLPFRYLVFFPIQLLLGRLTRWEIVRGLIVEFIWLLIFYCLCLFIWSKGRKQIESVGI